MSGQRTFPRGTNLPNRRASRWLGKSLLLAVAAGSPFSPIRADGGSQPSSSTPSIKIPGGEGDPVRFAAAVRSAAIAHPREFSAVVAAAFLPLGDHDQKRAAAAVAALLELREHRPAAILELVTAAASTNPALAGTIAETAMKNAPHYLTRQQVFGTARAQLQARGLRCPFEPISPGGTLNPAGITGDANSP